MTEQLKMLLGDEPLEAAEQSTALETLSQEPAGLQQLCAQLLGERRALRGKLARQTVAAEKAKAELTKAKAELDAIVQPPLHPGVVLRDCGAGRLEVAGRAGRQIVHVHPELGDAALRPGDEIWLDAQTGVAVARGDDGPRLGRVTTVAERLGERVVVRGEAEEERVLLCDPALAAQIGVGDRILVSAEVPCVLERLPERRDSVHLLQTPPIASFDDIGGLEGLVDELREELELHLFHPEIVESYALKLMRGMTLVGPPGVGKTLLARAIARFLADAAPDTRFMNVSPGALRGSFYGQTEQRIRELFRAARAAPGIVVMFWDELDSLGARGGSAGHEIDDRVMGTILAELDGVEASDRIFAIGATNRLDLIDDAIVRQGRFGDRIVEVPRPNRAATRAILDRLLAVGLPWCEGSEAASAVAAATSFLHAPRHAGGVVVRVTYADGGGEDVRARDVVSGALLAGSVERAKKVAAARQRAGGPGLREDDVVDALEQALDAEARKLSTLAVARRSLSLPRAHEIVRVDVPTERRVTHGARLRAA